jgi:alanine dehydrogenase
MIISILRESKTDARGCEVENRVILTPPLVKEFSKKCPTAEIRVESGAGEKIDFKNDDYLKAGAKKIVSHDEALAADLILGVKETKLEDFGKLKGNIFMSYQHFAESKERTNSALNSGAAFICLETMEVQKDDRPHFPCLAPMSEAAARILVRHADWFALSSKKIIGSGLSQTGLKNLRVTILGAGTVGRCAAKEFGNRGYEVHLIDRPNLKKLASSIVDSFFAVSSMYTSGRSPEKLITKELLKTMILGGCVYPVDIDQGGGIEGAFQTSILEPFDLKKIEETEVYCFAPPNIPSLGALTTSEALGLAILPYIIEVASFGLEKAAENNPTIKTGINIINGKVVHPGLANTF